MGNIRVLGMRNDGFYPAGQLPARQQDPPATAQAFQADIGTQPDDFPLIASAWMRFTQAYYVIYL
jgi:hypothetical protein